MDSPHQDNLMQGFFIASFVFIGLPTIANTFIKKVPPTDIGPQYEGD